MSGWAIRVLAFAHKGANALKAQKERQQRVS